MTIELNWEPSRWWVVLAPDGSVWCGTSDEQEARATMTYCEGSTLWREWRAEVREMRPADGP